MNLKIQLYKVLSSGFTYITIFLIYLSITAFERNLKINTSIEEDSIQVFLPDSIIFFALEQNGIRYRYGGNDESGFDCSGFTRFVFKRHDILLPHSSKDQYHVGSRIVQQEIRKADLLFFKGRNVNSTSIGHVGIAISDWSGDNVYFVHAATQGGIKIDSLTNPYYKVRYLGASRVIEENTSSD